MKLKMLLNVVIISYLLNKRTALKSPALRTLVLETPALMGIDRFGIRALILTKFN